LSFYPGQIDIGFGFLRLLERLGLVWDIQTPEKFPIRSGITPIADGARSVMLPK
jgi:stearoyl-CoA desaturase (delta-9 desaturase)